MQLGFHRATLHILFRIASILSIAGANRGNLKNEWLKCQAET